MLRHCLIRWDKRGDINTNYEIHNGKIIQPVDLTGIILKECTHLKSGLKFLLKIVPKTTENVEVIQQEIRAISSLDHPNISKLHEVFETVDFIYLIMELHTENSLAKKLAQATGHFLPEKDVCRIILNILGALRNCHDHNVVHRNITLDNIFTLNDDIDSELLVSDFGHSCFAAPLDLIHTSVTKVPYSSPEVIEGDYNSKCDIWAVGILTYVLLSGRFPFLGKTDDDIKNEIREGNISFASEPFKNVSHIALDFILCCLRRSGSGRPAAHKAQQHPWFETVKMSIPPPSLDILRRMKIFMGRDLMSRLCLQALAHTMTPDQLRDLRSEFLKFDVEGSGDLSLDALKLVLKDENDSSELDVEKIFAFVNFERSGRILYHEFIAATMTKEHIKEENIGLAFERMSNHHDYIRASDIRDLLGDFTSEQYEAMLQAANVQFSSSGFEQSELKKLLIDAASEAAPIARELSYDTELEDNAEKDGDTQGPLLSEVDGLNRNSSSRPESRNPSGMSMRSATSRRANRRQSVVAFSVESQTRDLEVRRRNQHVTENIVHEELNADIEVFYEIKRGGVLGTGASGSVRTCIHRATGSRFALKTLEKKSFLGEKLLQLRQEVRILAQMDHPNIVRLHECFETPTEIYLIMELCSGGELLDRLQSQPDSHFSERVVCRLVHSMLNSIRFCHSHQIVHRDLKLENFLFENESFDSELKLIDFGLSQRYLPGEVLKNPVGTAYYVAPEVLERNYNNKCDIWSIGVITYMLLSGTPPFAGDDDVETLKAVKAAKVVFYPSLFEQVSAVAIDFICRCLTVDTAQRPSAEEIQRHPWFNSFRESRDPVSVDILRRLRSYQQRTALSKLFLQAAAHTLSPDQIKDLRIEFTKFDIEETGDITLRGLKAVLHAHPSFSDGDAETIFNGLDMGKKGSVYYHEFIAATITRNHLKEENVRLTFEKLANHHDVITAADVRDLLGKDGNEEEVDSMLVEMGMPVDYQINYMDFKEILRGTRLSWKGSEGGILPKLNAAAAAANSLPDKSLGMPISQPVKMPYRPASPGGAKPSPRSTAILNAPDNQAPRKGNASPARGNASPGRQAKQKKQFFSRRINSGIVRQAGQAGIIRQDSQASGRQADLANGLPPKAWGGNASPRQTYRKGSNSPRRGGGGGGGSSTPRKQGQGYASPSTRSSKQIIPQLPDEASGGGGDNSKFKWWNFFK